MEEIFIYVNDFVKTSENVVLEKKLVFESLSFLNHQSIRDMENDSTNLSQDWLDIIGVTNNSVKEWARAGLVILWWSRNVAAKRI